MVWRTLVKGDSRKLAPALSSASAQSVGVAVYHPEDGTLSLAQGRCWHPDLGQKQMSVCDPDNGNFLQQLARTKVIFKVHSCCSCARTVVFVRGEQYCLVCATFCLLMDPGGHLLVMVINAATQHLASNAFEPTELFKKASGKRN